MALTKDEIQLALRISRLLENHLKSAGKTNLRSTDVFQLLARNGLFERDPKNNGIEFRRFLKRLMRENMLNLIPQCDGIPQDEIFTNWYFHSAADKMKSRIKSVDTDVEFEIDNRQNYDEDSVPDFNEETVDNIQQVSNLISDLNEEQREAVLSERKRILVLAGAGSGKTKTLIQKILYLLFVKNIPPSKILAITFTKNAATEMLDRLLTIADKTGDFKAVLEDKNASKQEIDIKRKEYLKKYKWISGLTVKTFHAYCYSILKERGGEVFDNKFKMLLNKSWHLSEDNNSENRETAAQILFRVIREECSDSKFLLKVMQYVLDHYVNTERNIKRKGNYDHDLKYVTLRGDKVRSKSERLIADWLYRHDIDYEYEKKITLGGFSFEPDFYIPEIDLYLEHLSNRSFPVKDKEYQLKKAGKVLEKTYEDQTHDIREFNHILEQIFINRLNRQFNHVTNLKFDEEFEAIQDSLNFFIEVGLLRAIDMIKVEDKDINVVCKKGMSSDHNRIKIFYEILDVVYEPYQKYCAEYSYLDFNDLLIKALELLKTDSVVKEYFQNELDYILIDEFQDVNNLQVELVKELLTEDTQLFCVGDDWQSIYGFRGSEVEYIINFQNHFDSPHLITLNMNYRSNDTIVQASNELIAHNKFLVQKEIKAFNKKGNKIHLYSAQAEDEDGVQRVYDTILQLSEAGFRKEDILLLYRRHHNYSHNYYPTLKPISRLFTHKTVHSAKGLEARVVFIIGLTGGTYGFPLMMESDSIIQVIKKVQVDLLKEEERRLFYVALTRAKEQLYLVSVQGDESEFISEIKEEYFDRENFLSLSFTDESTKCKECNSEIKPEFKYCPFCGYILDGDSNKNIIAKENLQIAAESPKDYTLQSKVYSTELKSEIVLKCLIQMGNKVGRTGLAKILKGHESVLDKHPEISEFQYYGTYSNYTQKELLEYIDGLMEIGLIESNGSTHMPKIRISAKGIQSVN